MSEKKRNPIKTLVLCVLITFALVNALAAFSQLIGWPSSSSEVVKPQWYLFSFGVVNTVLTISLLGVLEGKQWGAYGIIIALLAQVTSYTLVAQKSFLSFLVSVVVIVIPGVLFLANRRLLKN